jgi:sn-glycerol 3-phosphate transport system substrate-binding protein
MPIDIDVWTIASPGNNIPGFGGPLVAAAESFSQAHPGYRIRIRGVEAHLMPETVAEAVTQGNPPDIAENMASSTQTALDTRASNGDPLFVPVERAIDGRAKVLGEQVVVDDIVPAVRDYYTVAGEVVAIPTFLSTNLLYANKTMLSAASPSVNPVISPMLPSPRRNRTRKLFSPVCSTHAIANSRFKGCPAMMGTLDR